MHISHQMEDELKELRNLRDQVKLMCAADLPNTSPVPSFLKIALSDIEETESQYKL